MRHSLFAPCLSQLLPPLGHPDASFKGKGYTFESRSGDIEPVGRKASSDVDVEIGYRLYAVSSRGLASAVHNGFLSDYSGNLPVDCAQAVGHVVVEGRADTDWCKSKVELWICTNALRQFC